MERKNALPSNPKLGMVNYASGTKSAITMPKYIKYSQLRPEDLVVLGEYVETRLVLNYEKTAEVPQHKFNTDEGVVFLNSSAELDKILTNTHPYQTHEINPGDTLEIIFLGKTPCVTRAGKRIFINKFMVNPIEKITRVHEVPV